jgi:hypothetical protein
MRSEPSVISGNITKIRYELNDSFTVELDDGSDPVIADNWTNQLAIDAAFERRALVELTLEGARIHRVIHRVLSHVPPPDEPDGPPRRPEAVFITRISTQVQAPPVGLIAEVFFAADPTADPLEEQPARTKDPVIHLLCHGAYLSKHPLMLDLADSEIKEIKAVLKEHLAA